MWLPIHHEKHDRRKARDGEKDTDLSPIHRPIVRDIWGLVDWSKKPHDRVAQRIAANIAKLPDLLRKA
jgi:hypothetical protein